LPLNHLRSKTVGDFFVWSNISQTFSRTEDDKFIIIFWYSLNSVVSPGKNDPLHFCTHTGLPKISYLYHANKYYTGK